MDDLEEVLPENQNRSRVLITVTDSGFLCSFELENGEPIRPDSVLVGGPTLSKFREISLTKSLVAKCVSFHNVDCLNFGGDVE